MSASRKDGKFVIAVTLNDGNDWADHRTLLDLGLSLIESKEYSPTEEKIDVKLTDGNKISLSVPSALINTTQNTKVTYNINLPQFLYTPVKRGERIGSISYYCNGNIVCEKQIVATDEKNYSQNKFRLFFEIFKSIISNFSLHYDILWNI